MPASQWKNPRPTSEEIEAWAGGMAGTAEWQV